MKFRRLWCIILIRLFNLQDTNFKNKISSRNFRVLRFHRRINLLEPYKLDEGQTRGKCIGELLEIKESNKWQGKVFVKLRLTDLEIGHKKSPNKYCWALYKKSLCVLVYYFHIYRVKSFFTLL